jgi:hypothetical protein
LIFTRGSSIGFLKPNGVVSSLLCRGDHGTNFISATTDGLSAGHIYGLAADGNVYLFRTSNLLRSADPSECHFVTKFFAVKQPIGFKSIKGGLVVSS